MFEPQALFTVTDDVLASAVGALDPTELARLKLFVSVCEPPDDCCEYVAAYITNIRAVNKKNGNRMFLANEVVGDVTITYRDCVPTLDDDGRLPDATSLIAASQRIYENAWRMYRGIYEAAAGGTLFTDCPDCKFAGDLKMDCTGEEGACAGFDIKLKVNINT